MMRKFLTYLLFILVFEISEAQQYSLVSTIDDGQGWPTEFLVSEDEQKVAILYDYSKLYIHELPSGDLLLNVDLKDIASLKHSYFLDDELLLTAGSNFEKYLPLNLTSKSLGNLFIIPPERKFTNRLYSRSWLKTASSKYVSARNGLELYTISEDAVVPVAMKVSEEELLNTYYYDLNFLDVFDKINEELIEQNRFEEANYVLNKWASFDSKQSLAWLLLGWSQVFLDSLNAAKASFELTRATSPLDPTGYMYGALIEYINGNEGEGQKLFDRGLLLIDYDGHLEEFNDSCDDLVASGIHQGQVQKAKNYFSSKFATRDKFYQESIVPSFAAVNTFLSNKEVHKMTEEYEQMIKAAEAKGEEFEFLVAYLSHQVAAILFRYDLIGDYIDNYKPYCERAYIKTINNPTIDAKTKVESAYLYGAYLRRTNTKESSITVLESAEKYIAQVPDELGDIKGEIYEELCRAHLRPPENLDKLGVYAQKLIDNDSRQFEAYLNTVGYSFLGVSFMKTDQRQAEKYLNEALTLANKHLLEDVADDVKTNLATILFFSGREDEAFTLLKEVIASVEKSGRTDDLRSKCNNLGAMLYGSNRFGESAKYLEKAIAISEKRLSTVENADPNALKIAFEEMISSYAFLAMAQAKMNDPNAVFQTLNQTRSRVLLQTLKSSKLPSLDEQTVAEFQQTLAQDEIAIFYSEAFPGEMIILTVTSTDAKVKISDQKSYWVNLKAKWLDRFHAKDPPGSRYQPVQVDGIGSQYTLASQIKSSDMNEHMELIRSVIDGKIPVTTTMKESFFEEYLNGYYNFLMAPIESHIADKKKLLLFPDGIYNFLPFDALIMNDGRYLAEKFEIRFSPSAAVRKVLLERNYSEDRRDFLAMGGATYARMNTTARPLSNQQEYLALQSLIERNEKNNASQREAYATIFGNEPMNYLQGTLDEVNILSKIFPVSQIYTGEDMSERRIKSMSASGELSKFKIVHLATHGFAIPQFPSLSGIAMSIYPDERNGEDGYLTAPEITQLNLNADLVVLSACETALGKIYSGEGVSGLMQSLLIGGANRAMVTLWPVSDQGTMYFMTGLYKVSLEQGLDYNTASTLIKRKFINGEYGEAFKDPKFWAPYIQYGY